MKAALDKHQLHVLKGLLGSHWVRTTLSFGVTSLHSELLRDHDITHG